MILNMVMTKGSTSYHHHLVSQTVTILTLTTISTHICSRLRSEYTIEPPTLSIYLTQLGNGTWGDVKAARDAIKDEKILGELRGPHNQVIALAP
jgi:hypothetical protein